MFNKKSAVIPSYLRERKATDIWYQLLTKAQTIGRYLLTCLKSRNTIYLSLDQSTIENRTTARSTQICTHLNREIRLNIRDFNYKV